MTRPDTGESGETFDVQELSEEYCPCMTCVNTCYTSLDCYENYCSCCNHMKKESP